MHLDGCFIGACTTTEEELCLAALVLEAGLRSGLRPIRRGKRVVTPGSLIIIDRLKARGLLEIYREAGFEINAPSCSYCVGINDVDVAQPGEVWLSSQNRNFKNRMGKGSIGNITCAAAVAASSFEMKVTSPRDLLSKIDAGRYEQILRPRSGIAIMPAIEAPRPRVSLTSALSDNDITSTRPQVPTPRIITSRIQRFGMNVDTDAIIPAEFMPGIDDADLGSHCFEYFRPDFRKNVASGATIVVAEHGFGSGSSREDAVRALLGAGVECVIAKGFAFICMYRSPASPCTAQMLTGAADERNQLNMGFYSAVVLDDDFYQLAQEGTILSVDKVAKTLTFENGRSFTFSHSAIENTLLEAGGVLPLYGRYGKSLFREMIKPPQQPTRSSAKVDDVLNPFRKHENSIKGQLVW